MLGWLRETPTFFADEYIYAELGRSLAETGRPLIRGVSASFPALLQPIVTAPAWLAGDVETSFRLIQGLGALAMSLAAVPVFLLARPLGLGGWTALAVAALALVVPDFVYAGWVLAEPLAYPLALGAVAAGVAALARPSLRLQLAFLALAGLATFARVQFAVLPLCFVAAVLVVGLREQALVLAALVLPGLAFVAVGPGRALGFYEGILDLDVASPEMAKWLGADAMLLAYAAGVVLAPGAAIGLWLALRRPRSREELAFGALTAFLVPALLVEAAAYGLGGDRIQERYFFYAVPLVGILFGLYAARGWPHRRVHAGLALGLVLLAARVPLSGFSAADGKTNSPTLFAAARLEQAFGDVATASLVLALGVTALAGTLILASRQPPAGDGDAARLRARPRRLRGGLRGRHVVYPRERRAHPERRPRAAAVLRGRDRDRRRGHAPLALEPAGRGFGVPVLEPLARRRLPPARRRGARLLRGHPVTRPLAADSFSDTIRFRAADEIARSPAFRLVASPGPVRLALYAPGRVDDGWLGLAGSFDLWPESVEEGLAGTLAFDLAGALGAPPVAVELRPPGAAPREVVVRSGQTRSVSVPVCADGPWSMEFVAPGTGSVGGRYVSVQASEPVYRADQSACR